MNKLDIILIVFFGILAFGISIIIIDISNNLFSQSSQVSQQIVSNSIPIKSCTSNSYSEICINDIVKISEEKENLKYKVVGINKDDIVISINKSVNRYNLIKD